jgi:hypothetical protein
MQPGGTFSGRKVLAKEFSSVTAAKLFTVGAEELFKAPFAAG